MSIARKLFLLGGSLAFAVYAGEFVRAAGGVAARLAVLVQSQAGWEKHREEITLPWLERGATGYTAFAPGEDGRLDEQQACAGLRQATGILICGGHTPTYYRLFVASPVGEVIRQRHAQGVPVAGVSAGALVSMEICQLTSDETGSPQLQIAPGLGLAGGFVVGVHFSEWKALPEVLEVMQKTSTPLGLGIDEPACAVLEDGVFTRVLGKTVYRVEMTDFARRAYRVAACE